MGFSANVCNYLFPSSSQTSGIQLKPLTISQYIGVALASTLHLTPKQMAECWEAFSLNKNVSELTDHTFQTYRLHLIKDAEGATGVTTTGAVQSRNTKRQATNMVTPPAAKRQQHRDQTQNGQASVDSLGRSNVSSPRRTVQLPTFDERTRVGEVVASFNPAGWAPAASSQREYTQCVIEQEENNVRKPYRHMFTTMEERSNALENHLVQLGNNIVTQYGIGEGENGIAPLEQVNVPRQDKVCCVGRICNEVRMNWFESSANFHSKKSTDSSVFIIPLYLFLTGS